MALFTLPYFLLPFATARPIVCSDTTAAPLLIYPAGANAGLVVLRAALPDAHMWFDNTHWNAVVDADYAVEPV
jgi:hypothetical protein